jgi:hypothetical protein
VLPQVLQEGQGGTGESAACTCCTAQAQALRSRCTERQRRCTVVRPYGNVL